MILLLNSIIPFILILSIFIVLIRGIYIISNNLKINIYKELIDLLFILYIVSLFYMLTYKSLNPNWTTVNYKIFNEIFRYKVFSQMFITETIGNLLIFIPFGFFVAYYLNLKKVYILLLIALIISISIELIQLKIGRVCDIDDVLLNNLGSIVGYFIFKIKYIEK